jgi:hypothetical protein
MPPVQSRTRLPSRRARVGFVAGLGIVVLLVPAIAWASHQYSDVPNSHTFHDAITALTDTGIASGTGGGLFKPQDPVTRGQMAAFIHRSAGRVAIDPDLSSIGSAGETLMGSASLQLIGPTGGTQGVVVSAPMQLDHDGDLTASCFATLFLRVAGSGTNLDIWDIEFYDHGFGEEAGAAPTFFVTQGSGTTVTYQLYGSTDCGVTLFTDEDMMIVESIPFDGGGDAPSLASTLSSEEDREE